MANKPEPIAAPKQAEFQAKRWLLNVGLYLAPCAFALVLLKWGYLFADWLVICFAVGVIALFAVAGFLHVREKGFSKDFHEHPVLYVVAIVLCCCLVLGTGMYLVMRPPSVKIGAPVAAQASVASPPKVQQPPAPSSTTPQDTDSKPNKHLTVAIPPASHAATPPATAPSSAAPPGSDNASGVQSGSNNQQTVQTMTNSPGGMQAGRDLYAIGKMPSPERIIMPEDIKSASDILSAGSGSIEIITFPTDVAPNSEIGRFATKLQSALSQRGWSVYRNRENHLMSFDGRTDMPYGPHGVGCSASEPPSESALIAAKALAALRYPCAGPSVIGGGGMEAGHFTLYITVGTRIVPEQ